MQHVAQTFDSDIKLESGINNVPTVGNSSTPSSPRSPPSSPPCTPPDTPPDRFSDSFHFLSDSSVSGDEDNSEIDSINIPEDELTEEVAKSRLCSKSLYSSSEDGSERTVDPETQVRLQSLLKAAGINKFTAGDGKQLADPEVLRRLTSSVSCALDEAAAALTRMRSDSRQANKRALIKACTQGNVTAVRKLLKQGISVNETSEEGESLLSLACSAGYYELAQVLLAMHASVEDRGSKGDCTPLMEAASAGYVDIVRLLLAHGADVNAQSATGNTPLMYACAGGHVQTVRVFLDAGANVEDHNENGHTPLMEAASAGHVEVAKMLLKHGAGINTHSNEFKESALTLACYKGHLDMVNFLLQAGADQEHKTDEMHTALMEASMDGHVEVAKLLLDSGAQVNMPTDSFESPLTLAACGGHVDLAILLIERGANIEEVNDEGYTPLMEAAREGHIDMVAVLLQRGARINAQTEETQETALTLACCGGFIEVADYLIKHGADLELGASTPLMEAAQEGHLELVRYLLEAGANVHAHTQTADTALTYACENGHTDVSDLLLQYEANLEHESEGGRTPLMKACRAGHLCTVQFLVSKNADINRRTTNNDHTPLSLASAGGHLAIVQFLLDRGANMFHKLKDNSTMLIEAAKGGHTHVVQLLLDYPERCSSIVDNNVNLTVPATAATITSTGILTSLTATATQTCAVTSNISPEISMNNNDINQCSGVVSNISNAITCTSSENQNKVINNAVRRMVAPIPKTAIRNLCRDPRLYELRSPDLISNFDSKTIIAEHTCKDESQVISPTFSILQNVKLKRETLQQELQEDLIQQCEPQQNQQSIPITEQQLPNSDSSASKENVSSLLAKALKNKKVNAELQRVEQMMKKNEMMNASVMLDCSNINKSIESSCDQIFINRETINNQIIPQNSTGIALPNLTNVADPSNLPPPPPLIPISEVLQSTAISDRPKVKPTKKEGKILRKQLLHSQQTQQSLQQLHHQLQQQSSLQSSSQQQQTSSSRQTNQEEQVMQSSVYEVAIQQQAQALHLKHLAQINAQLQQQVIKNQQQIEMQQQQQQQLLQQQPLQGQQSPQLIGSGTITVATNAPNLADIFNHQELLAQIQQMDSNFAKTFPDFAEKTIEKEMRAMQQMMSCDVIQESIQRCHFLTSISEDEVSLEDVTNGTINIEEKRLCDIYQNASSASIDGSIKGSNKFSPDINFKIASSQLQTDDDNQIGLSNLDLDQQNCIQLFSMPVCSTVPPKQMQSPTSLEQVQLQEPLTKQSQLLQTPQVLQKQAQQQLLIHSQKKSIQLQKRIICDRAPTINVKNILQTSQMLPNTQQQRPNESLQQTQQQKSLQLQQQQKQLLQQKQQQIQHHFQQMQKSQPQKQQATGPDLNLQAKHELHRHLSEMKAIAQNATAHSIQNVAKCVSDSTVSHTVTSTQTTVASVKKKTPFDDSTGTLSKLGAMGKKMRTNSRVPPNAAIHSKEDGTNARVPSTNVSYNQNFSMDVDSETESNHDTALTLACAGGHEELVELLLSRGADIEHRDKKGFTPLILAATAGHDKVVDLLLNHNSDIEAQSERTKDTPLSLACSGGRYEVVELLLTRGANKEHRNVSDYTPLSLAASGGYVNIIKLLLSHGAEINSRTGSKLGISPLMLAAMNGHTAAVKLLLDMGSDINAQIETNRNTALTLACFQGRHEVVALLLERKANVEHRAKTGLTPLMEAASGGYVEVGRVLLEKGADVNAPPVPSSRDTALTIASDKGHVRFVELLISKGAQVEVKNKKGNSPMWLAANGGHLQVVELLYKVGADIDSQDNRKVSCLMAAFRKGHVKTVTWMVDRVNQFPSDQEMTRYISTINDKELLDKCQTCMKTIRVAKDEQAEKANEFATILLEELDLEKTREEFKRMAAARRKEKKREKKMQKLLEKRKQQEGGRTENHPDVRKNEEENLYEEYPASSSKDKKTLKGMSKRNIAENASRRNNVDIEEGDSGIDANSLGSCSSNEVKVSNTDRPRDKKHKKQPALTIEVKPGSSTKRESRSTEKFSEIKSSKKKKKESEKDEETAKDVKSTSVSNEIKLSSKPSKSKNSNEISKSATSSKSEYKCKVDNSSNISAQSEDKKKNRKESINLVYETSQSKNTVNDDGDFERVINDHYKKKQSSYSHEDSTVIIASSATGLKLVSNGVSKGLPNGKQTIKRGEEEWKEVVRKCLSPTYRVKKVSVPLTAISRVIGRAGCNINAIRSSTGAHIEIEKQSKGQGERIITIKGSTEATKQAHTLIGALIDDPELDITQMLPKSVKPVTSSSSWEKTTANTKPKGSATSMGSASAKTVPCTVTIVSMAATFPKISSSVPAAGVVSSASYTSAIRTSTNATRPGAPKVTTVTFASIDKKPNQIIITTTVTANSSTKMPSSCTKTTMSYTSAIMMSTGKASPNSTVPASTMSTTVVSQTFAAKVSETFSKEKEPASKPPIAPPPPTSTSIFIRPPPTASTPPTLPTTPNKPPFPLQTSMSSMTNATINQQQQQQQQQRLRAMPTQLSQHLSHPPPPLPTSMMSTSQCSNMTEMHISSLAVEEPSSVSGASEYSLFNDTFSKVTQQSMWGRDTVEDPNSQKGMNFASVVTASGSPNSSVCNVSAHSTFLDTGPPVQIDASKAPGYRGNSMCSPNLQKPTSATTVRPSVPSNIVSMSPSSLIFSNAGGMTTNSINEQMSAVSVTAAIARSTSVQLCSMDNVHSYTARALYPDKAATLFQCDQAQPTVSSNSVAEDLSMSLMRLKVVSRLNPRAPDFRVPVKQSPVTIPTNQLPPTHQPPPVFNQQSLASNYLSSHHPTAMTANSNMMSFSMGKFSQQQQQQPQPQPQQNTQPTDSNQPQWSLMNAVAQHSNYSQNDLISFVTPTTLNNLIHAQNNDVLSGLENGTLTNNPMNISPNSSAAAGLMAAAAAAAVLRNEERKVPPKPIGTERAWRTERERVISMEQDPNSWMLDQKQSWTQQIYRNNVSSAVAPIQTASAHANAAYSCLPQVPDDVRTTMLDGVYQNDHYNGIVQNTVLPTNLPPLLPHMNIGQISSGTILQSFNADLAAYAGDSFKMESVWDPNSLCMSDITLSAEKSLHQQQSTQPPNWTLSWNH